METTYRLRWAWTAIVVALALAFVATPAAAGAAQPQTRYSLVHGCFALKAANGSSLTGAEHVRMQATALGRYLLYRPDGSFLAAKGDGTMTPASDPSPAADWRIGPAGKGSFTLTPQSGGAPVRGVRFVPAKGCAVYPEASLDATGRPA